MCSFNEEEVPRQDQPCVEVVSASLLVGISATVILHDDLAGEVEAKAGKDRDATDAKSPEAKTVFNHSCRKDKAHGGDVEKEDQDVCKAKVLDSIAINLAHAVSWYIGHVLFAQQSYKGLTKHASKCAHAQH